MWGWPKKQTKNKPLPECRGKGQSNENYEKIDKEERNKLQLIVIPETNRQKQ